MNTFMRFVLLAGLTVLPVMASARQLWLEPDAGGARLYFGEFQDNLRETSPGLLDKLEPVPQAKAVGERTALKVEKTASSFAVTGGGEGAAAAGIVAEHARILEMPAGGKTVRSLDRLSARYAPDFTERPPLISLDIVPAGRPGAFKVFYDGKPLPRAKVALVNEAGWRRDLITDADGQLSVSLPWRGLYLVEVQLLDSTPGVYGRERYDIMRFTTTLSVRVATGLEGAPPPPAATPQR